MKRCETVVISKSLHVQGLSDPVLMSGPRQGGHWVDGMAKKVGVRRWRHWHYADDFDHALIFTKRLETELFLVFAKKNRGRQYFSRRVGPGCPSASELPLLSCRGTAAGRMDREKRANHR